MSDEKPTGQQTLQEARRAVEASRERIAATLDELEDRIVETKASIQRKADIARPAREAIRKAPLIALGAAVALGLFLGTRGGDHDEDEDEYGFEKDERKALEEWRKRRRKMLLEEAEEDAEAFEEESSEPGPIGRFFRAIGHEVAGVAVGIVAAEIAERMYGARADDEKSNAREPAAYGGDNLYGEKGYDDDVFDDENVFDDDDLDDDELDEQ
jgi:ElaB/YqjD/DUF883 family membrane-anchored ribosome-binding protein